MTKKKDIEESLKSTKKTPFKKVLGKGLGALLSDVEFSTGEGFNITSKENESVSENMPQINIKTIRINPYQPRKDFDEEALKDLANSIREHGVIQPITVRKVIGGYELITGERRLRASKLAKLKTIPAYILTDITDEDMLVYAIIENVQREELNPVEVAYGYKQLIDECRLTQEEVAKKVGKDRSTVTNMLRLLKLPDKVHEGLRKNSISMGHARALLGLEDKKSTLIEAYNTIIDKKLSVRATEKLVNRLKVAKIVKTKNDISEQVRLVLADIEDQLRQLFGTEVKIKAKSEESGTITFEFYSKDDFERLNEMFRKGNKG